MQDYRARIERVYAALHADPAGEHSLDALADLAALSRFHFHRVFRSVTGETLAEAIRRVRLHGAARALVRGEAPVAAVGRAQGYTSAAAFSRAFRARYGMGPAEFRRAGRLVPERLHALQTGDPAMYPLTLTDEPAHRVIGLPFTGPYGEIGRAYERLSATLTTLGLWPGTRGMVGIYHDDPGLVAPEALRSFAGVIVAEDLACPADLHEMRLGGGRHARLAFTGPYTGFGLAYDWLYGSWLPQSGERPADGPAWELYLNAPQDTPPEALRTDIFLPLLAR